MKKRIVLSVFAWAGMMPVICFSQNQNLNKATSYFDNYEQFNEQELLPLAKEKIDLASVNEGTKDKFKTWHYRGKIYLALFDQRLKEEMKKSTESDNTKKLISAFLATPADFLDESYSAFQKELQMDEKKIYVQEANNKLLVVAGHFSDKAYASLVNKNYPDAVTYYEHTYEMRSALKIIDTVAINNMAFASIKIKNYKKAEEAYGKLIEIKYKPEKCYLALIQMYYEANDTASSRRVINKAVGEMPESYMLLIEQINLLLKAGRSELAVNSIISALAKNPSNHELHLVLGQTYNKMAFPKDLDGKEMTRPENFNELIGKAEQEFIKVIELKPDYFSGYYTLGIYYYNLGIDVLKMAENTKDSKKAKVEEDRANEVFKKALPILERAYELDSSDKDIIKTLRMLYVRTGQEDSEKYKKLNGAQ